MPLPIRKAALLFVAVCLVFFSTPLRAAQGGDAGNAFAIQLMLSATPVDPAKIPDLPLLRRYQLYTVKTTKGDQVRYQLRLGFFPSADAAAAHRAELEPYFPGNWVVRVSGGEQRRAAGSGVVLTAVSEERLAELMEEGRTAMATAKYRDAVRIYTKVREYPDHKFSADALEYLGLARDRMGQAAHAKTVYEQYLESYPKGDGAERVRQRLFALLTARAPVPEKRRTAESARKDSAWRTYGGLSQFYRYSETTDPLGISRVGQRSLSTDLDLTVRRTGTYDIKSRISVGYLYDLTSDEDHSSRVSSAYLEASRRATATLARIGRQSQSSGGVLGRFDGVLLGRGLPFGRVNLVAGYPVRSSVYAGLETGTRFVGGAIEFGPIADALDIQLFTIHQQVDGIDDRKAVGGEIRYFRPTRSLFVLVDYDTMFDELNTFLIQTHWTTRAGTRFNLTVDERKGPVLTTSNALFGQVVSTIEELRTTYSLSEEEIRTLARERTDTSRSVSLGMSKKISTRLQLGLDATATHRSGTPGSFFPVLIAATPESDDYYVSASLTGSGLIKTGDITIFSLRYGDTDTSNTTSLLINTRYPVNHAWRINPRLRLDFRTNDNDDSEQWTVAPGLRTEYRVRKRARFELDVTGDWSSRKLPASTERTSGYFLSLGYRLDF